jgi:hypothetical protein
LARLKNLLFSASRSRFKKPDASEAKIRLNEGRFKRLLRALHGVSRELRAQLPRKALLLGRRVKPCPGYH